MALNNKFDKFIVFWPLLLLVGFASIYLPKVSVTGYRWTVELALGLFVGAAAIVWQLTKGNNVFTFSSNEVVWILCPIMGFIAWSGLTIFRADSWRAATHHTLLWALYLLFYVLVRKVLTDAASEQAAVKVLAIFIFIISSAGAIEFLATPKPITLEFTTRFYSYAEIIICVLPIVAASAVVIKFKRWVLWLTPIAVGWFLVVATTSRTMFISGLVGIAAFLMLNIKLSSGPLRVGRYFAIVAVLVIFALAPQLAVISGQSNNLTQRLAGSNQDSQLSAWSRLPMWGMAIEGLRLHPIMGVGGDNFYSDYKLLRTNYTAHDPTNELLEINEDIILERAHNEFLQILCELGLVGGAFFASLIIGICIMFYNALKDGARATTIASFCGIFAFISASMFSSYSFRFATNGLCFFFLLAISSSEVFKIKTGSKKYYLSTAMVIVPCLVVSVLMTGFCTARAISVSHFANSQSVEDRAIAKKEIEAAIELDPTEPVFHYYYGEQLYLAGNNSDALPQFRMAIDQGIATSPAYFDLLAALMLTGDETKTREAFDEAMNVYPRSVFLRTAFASYLKRSGQVGIASAQFQLAVDINESQARSWQLAQDEGLAQLNKVARLDSRFLSSFDLRPQSATLALANFQALSQLGTK